MHVAADAAVIEMPRRHEERGPAGDLISSRLLTAGVKRFDAREHLFCEGDAAQHVFRIEQGYACIYKMLPDGRRQVVDFAYPGDLVGLGSSGEHETSAQALGVCRVKCIPAPAIRQMCLQDPDFGLKVYEVLAQELRSARELLLSCCQRSAAERLATFLVQMSRRNGAEGVGTAAVFLPMTRSDIGDYLGLTIETVSRTFSKFKAMGLISLDHCTTVKLKDIEALERLAEGGGEQ